MQLKRNTKTKYLHTAAANINAKSLFFLSLAAMTILVFVLIEWPLITVNDAAHQRLINMGWLLFPHIFFGLTGLMLGPFQFSLRLRRRNARLHHTLGKIYIFSIFVASIFAALTNL